VHPHLVSCAPIPRPHNTPPTHAPTQLHAIQAERQELTDRISRTTHEMQRLKQGPGSSVERIIELQTAISERVVALKAAQADEKLQSLTVARLKDRRLDGTRTRSLGKSPQQAASSTSAFSSTLPSLSDSPSWLPPL
jgi:hypothetical protein